MNTQNGWSIIQANYSTLDRSNVPGTNVQPAPGVRKGDVAVVLHEVARQFHLNVQSLVKGWAWGWAQPQVLPGGTYSNHGSGTAIDLNAPNFPMGKRNMTAKQISECRKIVTNMSGVVRWGGEYPGANVDQMHFEIVGNDAQVKELAGRIKSGGVIMPKEQDVIDYFKFWEKRNPTKAEIKDYTSKTWRYLTDKLLDAQSIRLNKEITELKKQNNTDADKKLAEVRKIVN